MRTGRFLFLALLFAAPAWAGGADEAARCAARILTATRVLWDGIARETRELLERPRDVKTMKAITESLASAAPGPSASLGDLDPHLVERLLQILPPPSQVPVVITSDDVPHRFRAHVGRIWAQVSNRRPQELARFILRARAWRSLYLRHLTEDGNPLVAAQLAARDSETPLGVWAGLVLAQNSWVQEARAGLVADPRALFAPKWREIIEYLEAMDVGTSEDLRAQRTFFLERSRAELLRGLMQIARRESAGRTTAPSFSTILSALEAPVSETLRAGLHRTFEQLTGAKGERRFPTRVLNLAGHTLVTSTLRGQSIVALARNTAHPGEWVKVEWPGVLAGATAEPSRTALPDFSRAFYDLGRGAEIGDWASGQDQVWALSQDGDLRVFDLRDGSSLRQAQFDVLPRKVFADSTLGSFIAWHPLDNSGQEELVFLKGASPLGLSTEEGVAAVDLIADSNQFGILGTTGEIAVGTVGDDGIAWQWNYHYDGAGVLRPGTPFRIEPCGDSAAFLDKDGLRAIVTHADTGKVDKHAPHSGWVFENDLAYSRDGKFLAALARHSNSGSLGIWLLETATGKSSMWDFPPDFPTRGVASLAFSKSGHKLVASHPEGILVWEAR